MTTIQERLRGWALNAQVDMYLHGADQDLLAAADIIDKLVEALELMQHEVLFGDSLISDEAFDKINEALKIVRGE